MQFKQADLVAKMRNSLNDNYSLSRHYGAAKKASFIQTNHNAICAHSTT